MVEQLSNIDDSVVLKYLEGEDITDAWIFSNIVPGEHLFSKPEIFPAQIRQMNQLVQDNIRNFTPLNQSFFDEVFPDWPRAFKQELQFFLVVGCPYDAMTREKAGQELIIFDLNRIYSNDSEAVLDNINRLITHEFFHVLYVKDRPLKAQDYQAQLLDLVFNEGFAHYLSTDDIIKADYQHFRDTHYERNLAKLQEAQAAEDPAEQREYLRLANTGDFFDKFASIVGLFILLENEDKLEQIYKSGYENILAYV